MKRTPIFFLLVMAAHGEGLCQPEKSVSQATHTPRPEIAVGMGYGMGYGAFSIRNINLLGSPDAHFGKVSNSTVYTIDYRHPVAKNFVLGPAISVQSVSADYLIESTWDRYQFDFLRINLALRAAYSYEPGPWFKLYFGARAGVTLWHDVSTNPPPDHDLNMGPLPSGQLFFGIRYCFRHIGFGTELGLGTAPYLMQIHLLVRL